MENLVSALVEQTLFKWRELCINTNILHDYGHCTKRYIRKFNNYLEQFVYLVELPPAAYGNKSAILQQRLDAFDIIYIFNTEYDNITTIVFKHKLNGKQSRIHIEHENIPSKLRLDFKIPSFKEYINIKYMTEIMYLL